MKLNERQRHFDLTLTALAHPVRRAILERVMQTELRVTELAEPYAMSLNAVSKHIRMLERAGLISRRRVWREHLVSFNSEPLEQVSSWIEKSRFLVRPARCARRAAQGRRCRCYPATR